jgi:hypothetical protein
MIVWIWINSPVSRFKWNPLLVSRDEIFQSLPRKVYLKKHTFWAQPALLTWLQSTNPHCKKCSPPLSSPVFWHIQLAPPLPSTSRTSWSQSLSTWPSFPLPGFKWSKRKWSWILDQRGRKVEDITFSSALDKTVSKAVIALARLSQDSSTDDMVIKLGGLRELLNLLNLFLHRRMTYTWLLRYLLVVKIL